MKTLDEVIDALEICSQIDAECDKCPYKPTAKGWCEENDRDALHYLKEYQWQMTNPDGDHQQLLKCQALLQDFYRNEPLTWDELKDMEGKPIWVEIVAPDNWKAWFLISGIDDSFLWVFDSKGDTHNFPRVCLDTRLWQAYRKERTE